MTEETVSADDVARWMLSEIETNRSGQLLQADAATEISARFGSSFVYENQYRKLAISADVLRSFEKLCGNEIVWATSWKGWRKRRPDDDPGVGQYA